ncbi:MAG: PilZ domain-containing protein [Marinagarivorans sp.]|nr:PilZ domain-containing protein [Marinagarivorans sp.]
MDLATRKFEEKRDFIRMNVNCDAIITTTDGQKKQGYCSNLSGGGALLKLDQALDVNESIEFTINSQYGHSPVFSATAKVVRATAANDEPNLFWVAVRYH